MKFIQGALASNATLDDLTPFATAMCVYAIEHLLDLGSYMCPGIVSSYGPVVSHVSSYNFTGISYVCLVLFCKFALMVIKLFFYELSTTAQ